MSVTITELPDVPSRMEPATFADKGDAFLGALPVFREELNSFGEAIDETYTTIVEVSDATLALVHFKGKWSSLTGALTVPASVYHLGSYWVLQTNITDVTTKVPSIAPEWVAYNGVSNTTVKDTPINYLINPEFAISQEFGSTSVTITSGASIKYFTDQWYATSTGANITVQQITGVGTRPYSTRFTGTASNTNITFGQRLEGDSCFELKDNTVTVSFRSKASLAKTITYNVYYANAKDNFITKTLITTGSINITTVLSQYSFSFNAGANAVNGLAIEFSIPSLVASQTIDFDEIQMVEGSAITGYVQRLPSADLALCQRYWENGLAYIRVANAGSTSLATTGIYKVKKRVIPTVVTTSVFGGTSISSVTITQSEFVSVATSTPAGVVGLAWTASARL